MPSALRIALAALAALALGAGPASAKPVRVALVIGNAAYKDAPLANPLNDAADVARALEASGFTVVRRDNASLKEMHLALREFGDKLTREATGLFYFAGHGMQVRGRNFLLPVDADIAREDEVSFSALDLNAVLEKMDTARNPLNIVVLDACRNNPFGNRFQASAKGLAQVDAPPGTFIAFATAPGSVAADGSGRNGLYTQHLVAEMKKPGAAIEEVFKSVRAAVRKDSQGRQIPWESTSLETAFSFVDAPAVKIAAAPPAAPKPATGKSGAPRAAAPLGAPPAFAVGDKWTYRVTNLLTGEVREAKYTIAEIKGDEVILGKGTTWDLLGNPIKNVRGDVVNLHRPSSHFYVFPLRNGDVRKDLAFEQENGKRLYDCITTLKVFGEEEVDTVSGKMRGIRIERSALWKERNGKTSGDNRWTYWYNGAVKRYVRAEWKNTTADGKVVQAERFELASYDVQ
jgi:hypothetical protein